jgi:alkenylglycerophosphocholine hydrolase
MTASTLFLTLAAASALLAIACEERAAGRHRAFFLLKPLTTLLVLGAAACAEGADPAYRNWVCAALLLSMCGDIALMFEGDAAFLAGLGSFLIAHGLFVWAFWVGGVGVPPVWVAVPVLAGLAFFVWLLPRTGPLRVPVLIYGTALTAMVVVAAGRAELRGDASGWLAATGALAFLFSDSALAIRQFNGPYPRAQATILSSYWLAIGLVAASVVGSAALAPT